jgi:hypothetical protein
MLLVILIFRTGARSGTTLVIKYVLRDNWIPWRHPNPNLTSLPQHRVLRDGPLRIMVH